MVKKILTLTYLCSHGIRIGAPPASACRGGQECLWSRSNLPTCRRGRLWRRRRHFWTWCPSAYRRDSASVGLNAQRLVLQPVRCHQASAAIARGLFWTGHNPAKHSNITKSGDMKSYEARCGLERLPTRKPLQLPTVTGSSKGAPQSSEVQDLASLTNSACRILRYWSTPRPH